jgi:hypothetical protein
MQAAELYRTPDTGIATPANRVHSFSMNTLISSVDDWLDPKKAGSLKSDAVNILADSTTKRNGLVRV